MNTFETVIFETKGPVGYITFNRPQVLNAFNIKMRDELFQVLEAIRDDLYIKTVVFRGAGNKAFCAGADLSEFLTAPSPIIARRVRWERDIWGLFLSLKQPLIAALHGYVLGSGIEIALCCDIRIAGTDAKFGLPEIGMGIIPAAGGTQTLPRAIGRSQALKMLLTGDWIDSSEAERLKLVNKVVSNDELLPCVEKLANDIAVRDARVINYIKQSVTMGLYLPLDAGLEMEKRLTLVQIDMSARNSSKLKK